MIKNHRPRPRSAGPARRQISALIANSRPRSHCASAAFVPGRSCHANKTTSASVSKATAIQQGTESTTSATSRRAASSIVLFATRALSWERASPRQVFFGARFGLGPRLRVLVGTPARRKLADLCVANKRRLRNMRAFSRTAAIGRGAAVFAGAFRVLQPLAIFSRLRLARVWSSAVDGRERALASTTAHRRAMRRPSRPEGPHRACTGMRVSSADRDGRPVVQGRRCAPTKKPHEPNVRPSRMRLRRKRGAAT